VRNILHPSSELKEAIMAYLKVSQYMLGRGTEVNDKNVFVENSGNIGRC
jgi:hypothetical protein